MLEPQLPRRLVGSSLGVTDGQKAHALHLHRRQFDLAFSSLQKDWHCSVGVSLRSRGLHVIADAGSHRSHPLHLQNEHDLASEPHQLWHVSNGSSLASAFSHARSGW